jgi:ubiquinone/menaquinone biosynthesis C-methylase UbiE
MADAEYCTYLNQEIELFERNFEFRSNVLKREVGLPPSAIVLDIGCGAGQEMLPFALSGARHCIGIDIAQDSAIVGRHLFDRYSTTAQISFLRAAGEALPIKDNSISVIICRVALPQMHHHLLLSEVARVLHPNGIFFVKFYSPYFFLDLFKRGLRTLNLKMLFYSKICTIGSLYFQITGRQLRSGLWKGKEIYRTKKCFISDLNRFGLKLLRESADSSKEAPAFIVVKSNL